MAFKSIFSFYGGKSKIAHLYPAPKHELIIEPFAGGAAYAALSSYMPKPPNIWLNDLDSKMLGIWRWLTDGPSHHLIDTLPTDINPGTRISEAFPEAPNGLTYILQAEANQGTQGARGVHDQVTSMGAKCWKRVKPRLQHWIPRVHDWWVTGWDYRCLPNFTATWFIDPPYNNAAGRRYRESHIDYTQLAAWCRSRKGQVIVCENEGADWLPFRPLTDTRLGVRSRYQLSNAKEVIWTNS